MNVFSILNELESISGRNDKIAVLKKHNKNDELYDLLNMALNFNHKFHIKKFEVEPANEGNGKFHEEFMQLLDALSKRQLTGGISLSAVESFMAACTEEQAKWYSRVIKKDLRAGLDIKTVNAAGFNIPIFEVMLAKDGNDNKKAETIVKSGVYCSPKLDGYRCIAICSYGDVTLYSRNGSEYKNFPTIIEALSLQCQDKEFVLDGEIMSNDFNKLTFLFF